MIQLKAGSIADKDSDSFCSLQAYVQCERAYVNENGGVVPQKKLIISTFKTEQHQYVL